MLNAPRYNPHYKSFLGSSVKSLRAADVEEKRGLIVTEIVLGITTSASPSLLKNCQEAVNLDDHKRK